MNEKSKQPEASKEVPASEIRYINLYESEEKVYTRRITGFFQQMDGLKGLVVVGGFHVMEIAGLPEGPSYFHRREMLPFEMKPRLV